MHKILFRAMGTDVEIIVAQPIGLSEATITRAVELAKERMIFLESLLSRFHADSTVNYMNAGNGQWVNVSAEVLEVLALAQDAFIHTRGFFNPFMGRVLEEYGYKVTFENIGQNAELTLPAQVPFVSPLNSPLHIDKEGWRARIEPNYKIDLGGIAKGWIVEQAADVLTQEGLSDFICNAGGDMVCKSSRSSAPWVIGITSPFKQMETILNLELHTSCVATSGTYRRKWSVGNGQAHHILDPFVGQPVVTDIISCTVMHKSLTEAEVLAKVALILGTARGISWLNRQATDGWIVVTNTGEVKHSCN